MTITAELLSGVSLQVQASVGPCVDIDKPALGSEIVFQPAQEIAQIRIDEALPECLDDFIDESNPVRVIFVDALDLVEKRNNRSQGCAWLGLTSNVYSRMP